MLQGAKILFFAKNICCRVRKAQLSLGSAASNDSGFGSGGLDQQGRHSVRNLDVDADDVHEVEDDDANDVTNKKEIKKVEI